MSIESNYHQHTKDNPSAGWAIPAFVEEFSLSISFNSNLGLILFTPFLVHRDTTVDALSIKQDDTKKNILTFGFYSSDKYGLPNKLISNIGENKGFTWVTNDDGKEPTKTPYVPFKSDGENEVPWWNPFMEEGSDDVSVKIKKGIFWVGTIILEKKSSKIYGYYSRPDFPGLKTIGSPRTTVSYRMDSDELLPEGIDDLEKISLIFPKTLKQGNFEFGENGSIFVGLHTKKEG